MDGGTLHLACPYCEDKNLYYIQNQEGDQTVECSCCDKEFIAAVTIFVDAVTRKK